MYFLAIFLKIEIEDNIANIVTKDKKLEKS